MYNKVLEKVNRQGRMKRRELAQFFSNQLKVPD
jgi:hypothetical protein